MGTISPSFLPPPLAGFSSVAVNLFFFRGEGFYSFFVRVKDGKVTKGQFVNTSATGSQEIAWPRPEFPEIPNYLLLESQKVRCSFWASPPPQRRSFWPGNALCDSHGGKRHWGEKSALADARDIFTARTVRCVAIVALIPKCERIQTKRKVLPFFLGFRAIRRSRKTTI